MAATVTARPSTFQSFGHHAGPLLQAPVSAPPKNATKAWSLVDGLGQQVSGARRKPDRDFWWKTTGVTLAILLEQAQYSFEDQCRHLSLYLVAVVPELGARPDLDGLPAQWKSFMTDHHCPLEFSWEWNRKSELPTIRYSFEPVGEAAGTPADRLNKHAALRFVDQHASRIEGCDLLWFRHLWDSLLSFKDPLENSSGRRWSLPRIWDAISRSPSRSPTRQKEGETNKLGHESRCFLALDLNESSLVLKSYFMPGFKAQETGRSTMATICDAIETLPGLTDDFWPTYHKLMDFLIHTPAGQALIPEIVATDCVSPEQSRVKIYLRNPSTSWKSVVETLSLGEAPEKTMSKTGLDQFQKLWNFIWRDGNTADPLEELTPTSHRTGGILYYVELRPGKKLPQVKIYLPVRHYGRGDREVAAALQKFLRSTSRKDYSDDYVKSLETIISSSPVKGEQTTQTYLTCAILGDELRITSYLAPVVYRQMA